MNEKNWFTGAIGLLLIALPFNAQAVTATCSVNGANTQVDCSTITFCGTVQPTLDASNASKKNVCYGCHSNKTKAVSDPSSDPAAAYLKYSFDMGNLSEWTFSSYWKPGYSKAEASLDRINNKTMPPGVMPASIDAGTALVKTALEKWTCCLKNGGSTWNAYGAQLAWGPGSVPYCTNAAP